jgi:zinc transport system ATP-binding protein
MMGSNSNNIVSLENISLKLNNQEILKDINLEIKKGEITTLIGPNGGGKTSIARILIGALKPSAGKVTIIKNSRIGYMPQKLSIDHTIPMRAIDFINLTSIKPKNLQSNQNELAGKLGINNILTKPISEVSGGQLQRISLMRALINEPDILVLDEPTQFMDIAAQAEFYHSIEEIKNKKNCAILMISHDLHMVMQKTDNVICINHHICCHGSPESINQHPEYISLFGQHKIDNIAIYSHHHNHKH